MKICFNILYHHTQLIIARKTEQYYSKWGQVLLRESDFLKEPEHICRNTMLENSPSCDYVFILDLDEIITNDDMEKIIDGLEKKPRRDMVMAREIVDYASPTSAYTGRGHTPIIAVSPGVRFYDARCAHGSSSYVMDVKIHHISYIVGRAWKKDRYKEYNKNELRIYEEQEKGGIIPIEVTKELREIMSVYGG